MISPHRWSLLIIGETYLTCVHYVDGKPMFDFFDGNKPAKGNCSANPWLFNKLNEFIGQKFESQTTSITNIFEAKFWQKKTLKVVVRMNVHM